MLKLRLLGFGWLSINFDLEEEISEGPLIPQGELMPD